MNKIPQHHFIFIINLFAIFLIGLVDSAPNINIVSDTKGKNIVCYYSSWSAHRPGHGAYNIEDIPIDMCTHLVYSFIGLNNRTWELLVLDPTNDITKGGYRRFTSLKKKNPQLKTLISVGGWVEGGQKYSAMASSADRRQVFVNSVIDFLKWFNFDGLDIDWEFPGSADRDGRLEDKDNFVQLIKELREAFDKEGWGWSLSAVVPIMPFRVETGYNIEKLASMLDHIHLLTYDLRGNWTGFADVHTPLKQRPFDDGDYKNVNMNDGVELWERLGAPREKITIGLALYGRTYTLSDQSINGLHSPLQTGQTAGHAGPFTKANGTLAYYEICELQREAGWQMNYDEISESSYMVKGNQWIGFDDRKNLVEKVKYFMDKGYGGITVWAVDLDDFRGVCGEPRILLNAIYKQVTGRSAVIAPPTPFLHVSTLPTNIPTVLLTTSRPVAPRRRPTTFVPHFTEDRQETDRVEQQTPPTLTFFEDSERILPKLDHFRTTVAPVTLSEVTRPIQLQPQQPLITSSRDITSSTAAVANQNVATRRLNTRRRTTTTAPLTTTEAIAPTFLTTKTELIEDPTTILELATTEPTTIEITVTTATPIAITTTATPVTKDSPPTRKQRPLRVRGKPQNRPAVVADAGEPNVNQIPTRNKTRTIGRQFNRPLVRRTSTTTTTTTESNIEKVVELSTESNVATTTVSKPKQSSKPAVIKNNGNETTDETNKTVEDQSENTTETVVTTKKPLQRRFRRPLGGNKTAGLAGKRLRRPQPTNNQTQAELNAEESIQNPVFARFPSPPKYKMQTINEPKCEVGGQRFHAHQQCEKYWECPSQGNDLPTLKTCDIGLIWNPQSSICDWLTQNVRKDCE